MTKREQAPPASGTTMDMSHLRREARTAVELAVVAMVPDELLNRLAASAGLLEALTELPADSPQLRALVPKLMESTRRALADWQKWQARLPRAG